MVLVNSELTPALLMHMTYSNRLVWPQQWHTQTRCADGQLLYSVDYLYAPAVVNSEVRSTVVYAHVHAYSYLVRTRSESILTPGCYAHRKFLDS